MSDTELEPNGTVEEPKGDDGIKHKQIPIELNRQKRASKRDTTKARHHLEKLIWKVGGSEGGVEELEHRMETLWGLLEETQVIMDELTSHFAEQKDLENQKLIMQESKELEEECQKVIEKAQSVILKFMAASTVASPSVDQVNMTDNVETEAPIQGSSTSDVESGINPGIVGDVITPESQPVADTVVVNDEAEQQTVAEHDESLLTQHNSVTSNESSGTAINHRLKPLKVPNFDGDKKKIEEFWGLFESLVDMSNGPTSLKMARLRQSLTGVALDSIRGLGVSGPEYDEAKEILKTKFGGQRRQLRAHLDDLERLPPLRAADVQGFERFTDLVRVTVVKLQAEGKLGELSDGTLYSLLVKKLTGHQLETYTRWMNEHSKERSVLSLRDWLKEEVSVRVEAIEMAHGIDPEERERNNRKPWIVKGGGRNKQSSYFMASGNGGNLVANEHQPPKVQPPKVKPPCAFCNGPHHGIWSCRQFEQKSVEERWNVAKEKHLCFRCLSKDHRGKDCQRSQPCNLNGCRLNHHRLLHRQPIIPPSTESPIPYTQDPSREGALPPKKVAMMTQNPASSGEQCSLRTVPVWLKSNGKKVKVNALLDDASNETFLNENVANFLGLQERFQTVQVHVLNNSVETFQSMPVKIEIECVSGDFGKVIEVNTCPHQVTGTYKVEDWNKTKKQWPHLEQCDFPKPAKNGLVDLLIGVDNADLHYSKADVNGPPGSPIARLGPLGWTCIGPTGRQLGKRSHLIMHSFLTRDAHIEKANVGCCDVNNTLRKFWEIETYGTETKRAEVMTKEERSALEKVESSLTHNGSRYSLAVPWKEDNPGLPNNRELAKNRLESTERSLNTKDVFVKKQYEETIKSYVEKGYLRKLSPEERSSPSSWYLPHFPIVKLDKSTTKVRIVFDCSAKYKGVALNDVIHAGPKLQTELFDVLVRFRRNPIGLACDIREMYLRIEIEEKDRPYFRILWRDNETNREPDEYEFTRVVFGKNSAPMEAQYVAQENARRFKESYPLAAETVLKSTYMDDSIDSVEDEATAKTLQTELQELWAKAGMEARKWISNSKHVLAAIPEEHRASELVIRDADQPVSKTLGLSWFSEEDTLSIPAPSMSATLSVTKRSVLKKIATIFDPLGLISPAVIRGKMLLQTLWARGYDWDDEILDDVANEIKSWLDQLSALARVKIPRCIRLPWRVTSFKLITFVDASTSAFGAAVYARFEYEQPHPPTCRLLASKSKVAPLVPVTVPRLELMAAVTGLRLTQVIIRVLEIPMSTVTFYSDSLDVLWWIRGKEKDFRAFVANRVGEIQMYSDPQQWQHVSTEQNPADLVSRGISAENIIDNSLWWSGPDWLLKDEDDWPRIDGGNPPRGMKESKNLTTLVNRHATIPPNPPNPSKNAKPAEWRLSPYRYSSWMRLVCIRARVVRVLCNMRKKENAVQGNALHPEEIKDAEEDILREAQKEAFPEEYRALTSNKAISLKSPLIKLTPRIDDNGIIRMEGRLQFATPSHMMLNTPSSYHEATT